MTKPKPETTHLSANGRSKSLRILCAEDDEHVATILKCMLECGGHRVEHVGDGRDALERITKEPDAFDVLVTDHEMPKLSGLGLVEKIRRTTFAGRIVVHSSELHARDAAAYRALAVDYFLTKPASLDEFLAVVQRLGAVAP